jgi:hypothetical protein
VNMKKMDLEKKDNGTSDEELEEDDIELYEI